MIEKVNIVYFKNFIRMNKEVEARFATKRNTYGIGLHIGTLTDRKVLPTASDIKSLMGNNGFVTFDDIEKCLGEKAADKMIAYVEKNYNE